MKKRTTKRLLSVLLTALFAFSLLSVTVLADAPAADDQTDPVETVNAEDTGVSDIGGADGPEVTIEAQSDSKITFDRLPANLGRMGVGMACIIIVMGILIVVTMVLNKVTAPKEK